MCIFNEADPTIVMEVTGLLINHRPSPGVDPGFKSGGGRPVVGNSLLNN